MKQNFSQMIQSGLVLVHFEADWCSPCKIQNQILEHIPIEDIEISRLNIERNPMLAKIYEITALPTLILFQQGEILWKRTGLVPEAEIATAIQTFTQVPSQYS